MDGVRTAEGGEGGTGAIIRARIRVYGRLAGGLQALLGAPMAVCRGCGEGDGGIGHGKRRSRTGMARVGGDVQLAGWPASCRRAPSSREWNGSQSGQGATELLLPRPALGKMQGQSACRAGDPSGQGEEPPPEGLGGHDPLAQADAGCPAGQARSPRPMRAVQRARLWAITCTASQVALAAKRPEGRWFSPTPYLRSRIAFSISAWRRWWPPVPGSPRPGR